MDGEVFALVGHVALMALQNDHVVKQVDAFTGCKPVKEPTANLEAAHAAGVVTHGFGLSGSGIQWVGSVKSKANASPITNTPFSFFRAA